MLAAVHPARVPKANDFAVATGPVGHLALPPEDRLLVVTDPGFLPFWGPRTRAGPTALSGG
jgi:hypothetical protein